MNAKQRVKVFGKIYLVLGIISVSGLVIGGLMPNNLASSPGPLDFLILYYSKIASFGLLVIVVGFIAGQAWVVQKALDAAAATRYLVACLFTCVVTLLVNLYILVPLERIACNNSCVWTIPSRATESVLLYASALVWAGISYGVYRYMRRAS